MFAGLIFRYLSHSHCARVQMNMTGLFSVRCRQFSYQCKDKFEGSSQKSIKENTSAQEDLHSEWRLLQANQDLPEEDSHRRSLQVRNQDLSEEDIHRHSLQVRNQDLSEEDIHRRSLQDRALSFLAMVDESSLSPQQLEIHQAHVRALKAGGELYTDPVTGYQVMTRLAHLTRGDCCGNACRHCPFGQTNAPEKFRRTYNSAFYD